MSVQESPSWRDGNHKLFERNRARRAKRSGEYVPTIADAMLSQADRYGVADATAIDCTMDPGTRLSDWEGLCDPS